MSKEGLLHFIWRHYQWANQSPTHTAASDADLPEDEFVAKWLEGWNSDRSQGYGHWLKQVREDGYK